VKAVALRLEGPLQAWATQAKLGVRDTEREPSKSGVIGLVAAALGVHRTDDARIEELGKLEFAVRIDRPGTLLRDYHTAGGGRFRGDSGYAVFGNKHAVTSERYYLQNASFLAALGGPDGLMNDIASALRNPRWPLYLGRRACPPSQPILVSIGEGDVTSVIKASPRPEHQRGDHEGELRAVVECSPEDGDPRYDVPVSFRAGARRYAQRYVRTLWVDPPAADPDEANEVANG